MLPAVTISPQLCRALSWPAERHHHIASLSSLPFSCLVSPLVLCGWRWWPSRWGCGPASARTEAPLCMSPSVQKEATGTRTAGLHNHSGDCAAAPLVPLWGVSTGGGLVTGQVSSGGGGGRQGAGQNPLAPKTLSASVLDQSCKWLQWIRHFPHSAGDLLTYA